ncbi:MAG: branched-chain amino acid ABC transporter permease [Chloroflexi bacterium]|nr:branched-chain amino acid ABC transporter permease [Chloroflexota bacterium]
MRNINSLLARVRRIPAKYLYAALLLLAVIVPIPLASEYPYYLSVLWTAGIYILLGLSLNIIVGYAGLFQLGHAAFFAVGAYTVGILNVYLGVPIFLGLPVAIAVAGGLGYVISRPILHLRGDYLAIVTIAFGEILRMLLVNNVGGITGGANGLFGIAQPRLFGFTFRSILSHYYLVLAFVLITIVAMRRLENSRLGRAWTYVREDETAAEAMGVDTVQVKAIAFLLGSAWAGLAGALYASRITVISPDLGRFLESIIIFCIVVLGGTGSIPGVFVGAAGMIILPEIFRAVKDWRDGFVGLAMVLMMIFRPMGLWPSRRIAMELGAAEDEVVKAAA